MAHTRSPFKGYRRYAIVCEADLSEGLKRLAKLQDYQGESLGKEANDFSYSFGQGSANDAENNGGGGEILIPAKEEHPTPQT